MNCAVNQPVVFDTYMISAVNQPVVFVNIGYTNAYRIPAGCMLFLFYFVCDATMRNSIQNLNAHMRPLIRVVHGGICCVPAGSYCAELDEFAGTSSS